MNRFRTFLVFTCSVMLISISAPSSATTAIWAVDRTVTLDSTLVPQINDIVTVDGSAFWIATTDGLVEFNPSTETYVVAPGTESFTSGASTLAVDSAGIIWFSSGSGVGIYNPTSDQLSTMLLGIDVAAITANPAGGVYISDRTSRQVYSGHASGAAISVSPGAASTLPSNLVPEQMISDGAGTGLWITTTSSTNANRLIHANSSGTIDIQCDFTSIVGGTTSDWTIQLSKIARIGSWLHFGSPSAGLVFSLNETAALTSCDSTSLRYVSSGHTMDAMVALSDGSLFATGGGGYYQTFGKPTGAISAAANIAYSTEPFSYTIGDAWNAVVDSSGWLWFGFTNNHRLYKLETGLTPSHSSGLNFAGTLRSGQTLTANLGNWNYMAQSGSTYDYEWQRCSESTCTAISSATSDTYQIQLDDRGYSIRLKVTAHNRNGSGLSYYESSTPVPWGLRTVELTDRIVNIGDVVSDSQNNIWISDVKLLSFNPVTGLNSVAPGMESIAGPLGDLQVDSDDNIWFANSSGSIGVYSPDTDTAVQSTSITSTPNGFSPRAAGGIYVGDPTSKTLYSAVLSNGQIVLTPVVSFTDNKEPVTAIEDSAGTGLWVSVTEPATSIRLVHMTLTGTVTASCNLSDIDSRVAQGYFGNPTNLIRNGNWIYFGTKANQQVWSLDESQITSTCNSSNLHFADSGAQLYNLTMLDDGSLIGASDGTRYALLGNPSAELQSADMHVRQISGAYDAQAGWANGLAVGPSGTLWFGFTWGVHGTNNVYEVESGLVPVIRDGISLTGNAFVGQRLTGAHGNWKYANQGGSFTYNYQWQRCVVMTCTDISSATNSTYTLQSADLGFTVRVKVTTSNRNGVSLASYGATTSNVIATPSAARTAKLAASTSKSLKLTWSAPTSTHGAAIDKYKVVFNGHTYYTTSRSYTFTGLKPWQSYSAKIYAHNAAGYSTSASSSSAYPKFIVKKKSKTTLTSIITPASSKKSKWSESGSCSIKKSKLVAPKKAATCTVRVKNGSTTRTVTVLVQ